MVFKWMPPYPYSQFCALLFVKRDRQVGGMA